MTPTWKGPGLWPVPLVVGAAASIAFLVADSPWVQASVYNGLYVLSVVLLLRACWLRRARDDRRVLGMLAAGAALSLSASIGFWFGPLLSGQALAVPSAVDVLFLSSYAMFAACLLALAL